MCTENLDVQTSHSSDSRRGLESESIVDMPQINFAVEADAYGAQPFGFVTRVSSGQLLHLKGETVHLRDLHALDDKHQPSFDRQGFELVDLPYDGTADLATAHGWEDAYVDQMVQWLKTRLGARSVESMGYAIRQVKVFPLLCSLNGWLIICPPNLNSRRQPGNTMCVHQSMGDQAALQPACAAHMDVNQGRGVRRCQQFVDLDPETDRCAIFNIWRPLKGTYLL